MAPIVRLTIPAVAAIRLASPKIIDADGQSLLKNEWSLIAP